VVPLSAVPDSGSETGATSRAHLRSNAVNVAAHNVLTSTYVPNQVCCSNVCAVRDEEAAGSNPATPTQVTGHIRLSGMASYIWVRDYGGRNPRPVISKALPDAPPAQRRQAG